MFLDRKEAGEKLAQALIKCKTENTVVVGIPRGGIVVAAEVARILEVPLDIIIPRKIGSPYNDEIAIGAVCQDGTIIRDEALVHLLKIPDQTIMDIASKEIEEIQKRIGLYGVSTSKTPYTGKHVILVDDGIATGYTVMAALKSIAKEAPKRVLLAVPVAPIDALEELRKYVNHILCLNAPAEFEAVGQYYQNFEQTSHEEVLELLRKYKKGLREFSYN